MPEYSHISRNQIEKLRKRVGRPTPSSSKGSPTQSTATRTSTQTPPRHRGGSWARDHERLRTLERFWEARAHLLVERGQQVVQQPYRRGNYEEKQSASELHAPPFDSERCTHVYGSTAHHERSSRGTGHRSHSCAPRRASRKTAGSTPTRVHTGEEGRWSRDKRRPGVRPERRRVELDDGGTVKLDILPA